MADARLASQASDRARRLAAIPALMVGMVSVQLGAAFAKMLFPAVGPVGAVCLRVVLAALVLLAVSRPLRRGLTRSRAAWRAILAYGLSLAVMNTVFYAALQRLPLGVTVAIEFMGPLALAVLGSRRAIDLVWAVLALGGLMLLLQPWQVMAAHRLDPLGIGLALAAGTAWALYILAGRSVGARLAGGDGTALGMSVAALAVLPFGAPALPLAASHPTLALQGFGMAMLSSALPYSIEMMAMRRMSTRGFSILMSLEPAIAAVAGMIVLGERLEATQWLAIGGIMLASLGSAVAGEAPAQAMPPPD